MCRDRSTTIPSVSDWPLVPVPPPRGVSLMLEARFGHQRGDPRHIVGIQREHRRLRQALVDRVVGGQHGTGAVVGTDLATEAAVAQGFEEFRVVGGRRTGHSWAIIEGWPLDIGLFTGSCRSGMG
jgi:hypothetical protein